MRRHKRLTLWKTSASKHQQTLEGKVFYDLQNMCNISDNVIIWGKSQREDGFCSQKAFQQVLQYEVTLKVSIQPS